MGVLGESMERRTLKKTHNWEFAFQMISLNRSPQSEIPMSMSPCPRSIRRCPCVVGIVDMLQLKKQYFGEGKLSHNWQILFLPTLKEVFSLTRCQDSVFRTIENVTRSARARCPRDRAGDQESGLDSGLRDTRRAANILPSAWEHPDAFLTAFPQAVFS